MRTIALLAAIIGALTLPARAFDFADLRALVNVGEPAISPDGTKIAYVQSKPDFAKDRNISQLMLLDVRTRGLRQLTFDRRGISGPQWAPDGSAIFFSALGSGDDPSSQVFAMPMDGGDARQVTQAENGVDSFALSPDGKRVAYLTDDNDPNKKQEDAHHDAFQVGDNDYLRKSAQMPSHLWIVSTAGGTAKRLTSGAWSTEADENNSALSWSSDGRTIAVMRFPTPYAGDALGARVELVNAATGAMRPLTGNDGLEIGAAFAPRGDAIVYLRYEGGNASNGNSIYLTHPGGGPGTDARAGIDRNVDDLAWDAAGKGLYVLTPDGLEQTIWYRSLDGNPHRVSTGSVMASGLGNVAGNGTLVFVGSTASHPPEIYVLTSPNAQPVRLTDVNARAASASLGRVTAIAWTGPGGFKEDGVLTYPPSYVAGKKYPLVLTIHGGPQGASTMGWGAQRQLFASHGYLVFEPNYRGSTNLGDAYQRAISGDTGDGPGKDVMAGVAAVERLGIVDTSRIAVSGWSYGGYMTSWLIGHYHIWKTAVSGASLDDWLDDFNLAFYVYSDVPFFGGVPSNPKYSAKWRAQSPIAYAQDVTTPTLILGDVGDNNVTITNSYKLYHALKDNNVPVTFVAYPVEGHHPSDPVRSEDVTKRWLAWLDKYLK